MVFDKVLDSLIICYDSGAAGTALNAARRGLDNKRFGKKGK